MNMLSRPGSEERVVSMCYGGAEAGPEDVGIEGIERVKRKVQSAAQRILRTEYLCTCREHGAYRMDRVSRMASFFAQHSGCM